MKRGYTLIEVMLVLLFIPLVLVLSVGVLRLLVTDAVSSNDQLEVFKLQFRYLMQTVSEVEVIGDTINYSYDGKIYTIKEDRNRLVKNPGYEILLFDIDGLEVEGGCLRLTYGEEKYCLQE